MPARIDRGDHFDRIAAATARIAAEDGLAAASLRRVAAEADLTLSAVRHLCPDTHALHQRTVKWLRRQAEADAQPFWSCETPLDMVRTLLHNLVPQSDDARMRAKAWAAFRADAPPDGLAAQVVELAERQRIGHIAWMLDGVRRMVASEPRPSRVVLASEVSPPVPEDLDATGLHLLVLAAGLTSLVAEHRVPLGQEALDRWLQRLEPRHLDLPA